MSKYEVLYTITEQYVVNVDADSESDAESRVVEATKNVARVTRGDTGILSQHLFDKKINFDYILEVAND